MILKANQGDAVTVAELAAKMWQADVTSLAEEFDHLLRDNESAIFLCRIGDEAVGFAQCQLRHDYVEGTHTSPVGYLEGIFIEPDFRHMGHGKELLLACENWAKEMGCTEFASDCELDNVNSLRFHMAVGFSEANRIICFTKPL